jgi:AcrR family transcriptional regulator
VTTTTRIDTREAILDATDRIMSRYGFRKMTMDDLAREAGVSKKTIYLHFKNKEDVGLSSIGRVVLNVHTQLEQVKNELTSPDEKLRRMLILRVIGRIESIKDYYWSLDELFAVVRPAYMARRQMYFDREAEMIAAVLEEGRLLGVFQCPRPKDAADALLLATNAFLPYSLSVRDLGDPKEIAFKLEIMVDMLLRGLMPNLTRAYGD